MMRDVALIFAILTILGAGFFYHETAKREQYRITDDKAILAIIGEAEGEGPAGMHAVAAAIRNRGTLRGVNGLRRAMKQKHWPVGILMQATLAWDESAMSDDPTGGATEWRSIADLRWHGYPDDMVLTYSIGGHYFFKSTHKQEVSK